MLAYIQAPNMYFDITAYIHAKGMYYCVSRYLYMGYEVLEYVPGSPITRYVCYPDSPVPNTYATPPVTGYLERPLPGMPITQYILAPCMYCTVRLEVNKTKHEKDTKNLEMCWSQITPGR